MTVVASAARRARYWLTRQAADIGVGRQEGLQRDRACDLAGAHQLRRQLEDLLMDRLVEMPRLRESRRRDRTLRC